MSALHHLHAAMAGGTKQRAAVSLDIGSVARVRLDCGKDDMKPLIARRIAVLWNMHEGIPTEVLEAGAVRAFYSAVQALCDRLSEPQVDFAAALAAAKEVEAKWSAITIEPCNGKRADCSCSEAA